MADADDRAAEVDLVRAAYESWGSDGGLDDLLDRFADPEIVWVTAPSVPEPGPHRGHEEIRRAFGGYLESFDVFRSEPERVLPTARPGELLALVKTHIRGKGSGAEVSIDVAHLIELRDGKIVRFEVFTDRAEALRRAGLAPT